MRWGGWRGDTIRNLLSWSRSSTSTKYEYLTPAHARACIQQRPSLGTMCQAQYVGHCSGPTTANVPHINAFASPSNAATGAMQWRASSARHCGIGAPEHETQKPRKGGVRARPVVRKEKQSVPRSARVHLPFVALKVRARYLLLGTVIAVGFGCHIKSSASLMLLVIFMRRNNRAMRMGVGRPAHSAGAAAGMPH